MATRTKIARKKMRKKRKRKNKKSLNSERASELLIAHDDLWIFLEL